MPGEQVLAEHVLLLVVALVQQQRRRSVRQTRIHSERGGGGGESLLGRDADQLRRADAAELGRRGHADPTAFAVHLVDIFVHRGRGDVAFRVDRAPFLIAGLAIERRTSVRNLTLFLAPIAFLGLLYPLLMPVRFEDAGSMLVRYPWLGVHVFVTLLGHVGFALSFLGAGVYLLQRRALKRGRLNHYLPALDSASRVTFYGAGGGFFFFTIGLGMGMIWLFGAPGEFLGRADPKIILAIPTWVGFALYLYARGVRGMHGSKLKWIVIAAFTVAILNYVLVPHQFSIEEDTLHPEGALGIATTVSQMAG